MTSRYDELRAEVREFHRKNPHIFRLFDRFAREKIAQGYTTYSANGIFERIRWEEHAFHAEQTTFKVNNNYRPFYSRAWMAMNPEYEGFFRTREQISKHGDPTDLEPLGPDDFPTWPQPPDMVAP